MRSASLTNVLPVARLTKHSEGQDELLRHGSCRRFPGLKVLRYPLPLPGAKRRQGHARHYITVTDNGIGIDPIHGEAMFRPFRRFAKLSAMKIPKKSRP